MGGRIGVRMGGIGEDQDGDVPPDDVEANQPRANDGGGTAAGKEESKNNSGGQRADPFSENQYNVEDDIETPVDGHINQVMSQGIIKSIHQSKNQKDNSAKGEAGRGGRQNTLVPLTVRRPGTLDPYELSYQMVYDVNILSTQIFSLWYKLIEVITINPKFVCEYLRVIHEEKMREYWGELIYRTVFETKDLSVSSSQNNVTEIHRNLAMKRRRLNGKDDDHLLMKSTYTDLNIIEISEQLHATSGPAGQALSSELKKLKTKQALRDLQNL